MHLFLRQALVLIPPFVAAYPPPEPCTGWCFNDIRDPNVVYRDGTYYRFATDNNFSIATAPSLSGPWERQGHVLPSGPAVEVSMPDSKSSDDGKKERKSKPAKLWAPDVYKVDDTYYMTYTATRRGSRADIGVATSETLKPGSWMDHGSIGLPEDEDYNRLDSNLFRATPDGQLLLNFGSYRHGLYQLEFDATSKKVKGDPQNIAFNASKAIEGGYEFQWEVDGKQWYYLFFSSGICCNSPSSPPKPGNEYKTMVCRSSSPTGPFVDATDTSCDNKNGGTQVLGSSADKSVYGPGGEGVLYDEQLDKPVIYYHYMNASTGLEVKDVWFGWNGLDFSSGWPVAVARDGEGWEKAEKVPATLTSGSLRVKAAGTATWTIGGLLFALVASLSG